MKYCIVWILLFLTACARKEQQNDSKVQSTPSPWFVDVATDWGVDFTYDNGAEGDFHIREVTGGAPALFDYDNDGDLDLYIVQGKGKRGNALFENVDGVFVDRSLGSGATDMGYGIGVSTGDYDNDGDTDLYVTNFGVNALLRNDGGGTFTNVTTMAGVEEDGFSACSAFGDLDNDGDLDLVVTRYLDVGHISDRKCLDAMSQRTYCNPAIYKAELHDTLFFNNGDGTFTDVTKEAGLSNVKGTGLGVFISDLTGDELPDIFIANDAMPDRLWVNQGDGTFVDEATQRNVAMDDAGKAKAGMGATPVDIDQDGDIDVFVTNILGESDSFYRNEGDFFQDITRRSGLSAETRAHTRWGIVFADFNNDTLLDLYETTGGVVSGTNTYSSNDPLAEPNLLFEQVENGRFNLVDPKGGTTELLIASSHGVAAGDIDGDGGVDLVVVNSNAPLHILKNITKNRGGWISFQVLNAHGSNALGAQVDVELQDGSHLYAEIKSACGYASAHDPRAHFGLGDQLVSQVTILWPDGTIRVLKNTELQRTHVVEYAE
jgi:enediyne biosynthesis protein E4